MRRVASLTFVILASAFSVAGQVPLVTQPLVPDTAAPGGATFTLTVNGTGFPARPSNGTEVRELPTSPAAAS
jgi:hypothetical protein